MNEFDDYDDVQHEGVAMPTDVESYANLSMGDMQDSLPEPEAMEDNALSRFHIQWEVQLREKAALEEGARLEVLKAGQKDQETFMEERASMRDERMTQNRAQEQMFLEQLEEELESENPWERITSLIDMQVQPEDKLEGVNRMKSMILYLKNDQAKLST